MRKNKRKNPRHAEPGVFSFKGYLSWCEEESYRERIAASVSVILIIGVNLDNDMTSLCTKCK